MGPLVIVAVLFALMWALVILPQQRRVRAHEAVVARLEVGDEVMITSGIYGTITALDDQVASIEVSPGTVLRVARGAVGRRLIEDAPAAPEPDAATDDDDAGGDGPASPVAGTAADRAAALHAPRPRPLKSEA